MPVEGGSAAAPGTRTVAAQVGLGLDAALALVPGKERRDGEPQPVSYRLDAIGGTEECTHPSSAPPPRTSRQQATTRGMDALNAADPDGQSSSTDIGHGMVLPRRFAHVKVVVAGGSGALGRRLCADLASAGYEVVVLTRRQRHGPHRQVEWDGRTVGPWREELEGSAVVNLAGELVDRRPTAANVSLLTTSRVDPTLALVEASRSLDVPVPVWVQASTLAIYGDAGDRVLDELAKAADGPPQMAGVARSLGGRGRWRQHRSPRRAAHGDRPRQ